MESSRLLTSTTSVSPSQRPTESPCSKPSRALQYRGPTHTAARRGSVRFETCPSALHPVRTAFRIFDTELALLRDIRAEAVKASRPLSNLSRFRLQRFEDAAPVPHVHLQDIEEPRPLRIDVFFVRTNRRAERSRPDIRNIGKRPAQHAISSRREPSVSVLQTSSARC